MKLGDKLNYEFGRQYRSQVYNFMFNNIILLDNGIAFKVPTIIKVVDWTKIVSIIKTERRKAEIVFRDEDNKKKKIKVVYFSRNSKMGFNFDTTKVKYLYIGRCKIIHYEEE